MNLSCGINFIFSVEKKGHKNKPTKTFLLVLVRLSFHPSSLLPSPPGFSFTSCPRPPNPKFTQVKTTRGRYPHDPPTFWTGGRSVCVCV